MPAIRCTHLPLDIVHKTLMGPFFHPFLLSGCSVFAALEAAEICACASLLWCIHSAQLCSSGEILYNSFFKEAICDISRITAPHNIGNNGLQDFALLANYIDFCLYGIYLFRLSPDSKPIFACL